MLDLEAGVNVADQVFGSHALLVVEVAVEVVSKGFFLERALVKFLVWVLGQVFDDVVDEVEKFESDEL